MKKLSFLVLMLLATQTFAHIYPIGSDSNTLYYSIGGEEDFVFPPVSDTTSIRLDADSDLGFGNSCTAFNPALSIRNTINNLKDSVDNLEQSIIASATGGLIQLPMYLLAQANPTAYSLLNNALLNAHKQLDITLKDCYTIKDQIARGENPYQDWGTISINDQWNKHLTFVASGDEDINYAKKDINAHHGEYGVPWVQGYSAVNGSSRHAGGKNQPPIRVIEDTVKAGYNTLLNRNLDSEDNAPDIQTNATLRKYFINPKSATNWITSVLGDQIITTCHDQACQKTQGSVVGHGLLTWVTSCQNNKDNCSDTIRDELAKLVVSNESITKEKLAKVSADEIAISPDVIVSLRGMDAAQQVLIINKLAQEIATQRVIDKAFIAKNILATGAQIPVISANHPAQIIIKQAINNLDDDIRSIIFESQMRKQTVSSTISDVLKYSSKQQQNTSASSILQTPVLMQDGAILNKDK
jgi:integrating conjugative element protein (TIGR03755 family)